jgi:hypothetical protein
MDRESYDSPFHKIASAAEVADYNKEESECCEITDFRVDIRGYGSSPWNKSCARVFAESFLDEYPQYTGFEIEKSWTTHFNTLRSTYAKQQSSHAHKANKLATKRRAERKNQVRAIYPSHHKIPLIISQQLYQRRLHVAAKLQTDFDIALVPLLSALGTNGISSDESDHEAGQGEATYFVKNKNWRSFEVTTWLRVFDAWHLRGRYGGEYQASPGAWPHFRTPSTETSSERPAVAHLPKNFYNPFWLSQRKAFQVRELKPTKERSLALPPAITRCAV